MNESIVPVYLSKDEFLKSFKNEVIIDDLLQQTARQIIDDVRAGGDRALLRFTEQLDRVKRNSVQVSRDEWKSAGTASETERRLFQQAAENIRQFHKQELNQLNSWNLHFEGGRVGQQIVPIRRVGVYVPGGTAAYPSSVLMNVIPAQVAGVEEIVLVSPPDRESGKVNSHVLAIVELLEISEIYAIGGVQAIAALAYGTESIKPVDKITGPGNKYVAEAKRQVFGTVGIDSIAGPSEIVILADQRANPEYLAADLLSQAEHDIDARAILISDSERVLQETSRQLKLQLNQLPRQQIAEESVRTNGAMILVTTLKEGIDLINKIAPEHLELQITNPKSALHQIKNVGAVFLGDYTPEPVGDYWAGSNHILPTSTSARYSSALSVRDFLKWISVVDYSPQKLRSESEKIIQFAELEGLSAHANAIRVRL